MTNRKVRRGKMVRLQPFGNTGHGPDPRRRRDESEQETGSPNDGGMIDDFRLWGSSRCRRIGEYSTETGLLTWMVHTIDNHNASLRGRSPRRCGWRLSRNAPSEAGQHRLPASDATKRSEAAPRAFRLARRGGAPCEAGDTQRGATLSAGEPAYPM